MQPISERITVTLDAQDLMDWLALKGVLPNQQADFGEATDADMYVLPDGRAAINYSIKGVDGVAVEQEASGLNLQAWLRLRIANTSGNP